MKRRRIITLGFGALVLGWYALAGQFEARRIAVPLPRAAQSAPDQPGVERSRLLADVQTLAAPAMAGRRTGSEGGRQARAWLIGRLRALGVQPFGSSYAQPFAFTHHSLRGLLTPGGHYETRYDGAANLLGFIPGTSGRQRFLVLSAHYDHLGMRDGKMYPGADDNASGVAAVLAAAAWLRAHPPLHPVLIALFDGEEEGLEGARHFMAAPPVPRAQLAFNLNLDMVSHNDQNQIFASGVHYTPLLQAWVAAAARRSTVQVLLGHDRPFWLAGSVEDWTEASDHGPFHAAGIPYLYFGVADHADYHQPSDTFEHINPDFFVAATGLILDTLRIADAHLDELSAAP